MCGSSRWPSQNEIGRHGPAISVARRAARGPLRGEKDGIRGRDCAAGSPGLYANGLVAEGGPKVLRVGEGLADQGEPIARPLASMTKLPAA